MDRDKEQEQNRMWAATRLTEAAVTQLFQGASTPTDARRGQQIGQIVAELYSAIYTGEDVQNPADGRPSLTEKLANASARSPVLPRPTRNGQNGPMARPAAVSAGPAVGRAAEPAASGPSLPPSIPEEGTEEIRTHEMGMDLSVVQDRTEASAEISEIAPYPEILPDNSQDSLQSLLSEIAGDEPQAEALEEPLARAPEAQFYPGEFEESLESQLATIASEEPMEPETSTFDPRPLPTTFSPKAPSPPPVDSGVVVLEGSEKRVPWWQFWKR